MYKNYLIVAVRNILKQKTLNILNVLGLSIGIAAGLIIAIHIREELSFETSFENHENIYRVNRAGWATTSPILASEFRDYFHDIDAIARFSPFGVRVINTDNNNPGEALGFYADSSVINLFGFKVIDGDRDPLVAPNTIVITRSMAKRFFGDETPINKSVTLGGGTASKTFKLDDGREMPVTAVIDDPPANSHLKFDFLVSMPTFYGDAINEMDSRRGWMIMYTYFSASPEVRRKIVTGMPQFIRTYYADDPEVEQKVASNAWQVMPLTDIHLHSHFEKEMSANSDIVYVYVFVAIELLILLVASANFVALFTTQTLRRTKEVGMRKVMGAGPGQITMQLLLDVTLLTVISCILSIGFYQVGLPLYNDLSGNMIGAWEVFEPANLPIIGTTVLLVILLSSLYPAIFVSGYSIGSFLRRDRLPQSVPNMMRRGMVVFQFAVSAALIAAALIVQQQMELIKEKDLGFEKDQVINVKLYGDLREKSFQMDEAFKSEFLKNPNVLSVGRTGRLIGERLSVETVIPEGKNQEEDQIPDVRVIRIDDGFLETMSIAVLQGRNFSKAFNDSTSYIINETAAKAFGLTDPLGSTLENQSRGRKGKIVGVIKDYHFATLHAEIEPMVIEYEPGWTDNLVIKVRGGKTTETLDFLKTTVSELSPNSLFIYQFLDDRLDALYKSEDAMGKMFQFFSILAIIIASLGLFGLSSYMIETRAKELGIRKVLGATIAAIVSLLWSSMFRLIAIGFCIAVPLCWYAMEKWLSNFAYKIEVHWWVFGITGVIVVLIAALAIGVRTINAALANPVKSLRSE